MERVVGEAAAVVGHALRAVLVLVAWVPTVVGPALVLYGVSQWSRPAAYVLAGLAVSLLTFVRPNQKRGRRK